MTDFSSRLNQFRAGLQDQQDSYNKLAANMSQMGRSFVADKVAEHFDFTEKIGGSMVGVGAGIQSGKKIATRIMKYRKAAQAKRNNTAQQGQGEGETQQQRSTRQRARDAEGDAQEEQEGRTTGQTDEIRLERENPLRDAREIGQRGDAGPRGEIQEESEQKNLREAGGEDEEEEEEGGGGARVETTETSVSTEAEGPASDIGTSIRRGGGSVLGEDEPRGAMGGGGGGAQPPLTADQQAQFDRLTSQRPISGEQRETEIGGGEDRPRNVGGGDDDLLAAQGGEGEAEEGILSRVGSAVGDVARAAGGVAKRAVGGIADTVAEAGVADAIPFVGELVGLGMLIHGIVKAHKHEENGGGPKLSAANPEATEQSGGFSADMLKGMSGAPTIV